MSQYTRNRLRQAMESLQEGGQPDLTVVDVPVTPEIPAVQAPASEVVNLIQSTAQAQADREYVEEARSIVDGVRDFTEAAEVVNARGGITQEAYGWMAMGLNRLATAIGAKIPQNLNIGLEAFNDGGRVQLDMQELNGLLATVSEGTQRLEARSAEAVCRMLDALAEALPAAQERLCHVAEIAKSREHEPEGNVVFGDGLNVALSVDGQVPDELVNYLQRYALLGQAIITNYSTQAFDAAMAVATLPDTMDFASPEAFWASVAVKVDAVEDPRNALTEDQLVASLPNGGRLFGDRKDAEIPEGGNPVLKKLIEFSESRAVEEQANDANVQRVEEGQPGYGRKALPLNDIRVISRSLCELLEKVDVNALAQRSKAVRGDVISAVSTAKSRFAETNQDMKMFLSDQFGVVVKYIDTAYLLSDWPILNYLSNLVFTTNAFVLYAERSLALPEGGVPDEQPEAQAPPAADPTAAPPAPEGDPNAAAAPAADATDPNAAPPAAGTDDAGAAVGGDPTAAVDPNAPPADGEQGTQPADPANPDAPATQDGTTDPALKSNDPAQDPNVDPDVAAAAQGEITPAAADAGVGQPKDAAGADVPGADAAAAAADDTGAPPADGTTPPPDGTNPPATPGEEEEDEDDDEDDQQATA